MNLEETGYESVGWINFSSGQSAVTGCYGHGKEHSGYIKGGQLVDWMRDY
jgi:hypothetical protein